MRYMTHTSQVSSSRWRGVSPFATPCPGSLIQKGWQLNGVTNVTSYGMLELMFTDSDRLEL